MSVPGWRSSTAGSRVRVAMWLYECVGSGGVFSKADLREAFPGVEQVDRRMRDLRADGWEIATYREDRSLLAGELRLVRVGGRVWESGYRSQVKTVANDKQRAAVFAKDGWACTNCGVVAGEAYVDDRSRVAKLLAARLVISGEASFITVCGRCVGEMPRSDDVEDVLSVIDCIGDAGRDRLAHWMEAGSRGQRDLEDLVWIRYKRLPIASRELICAHLMRLSQSQ